MCHYLVLIGAVSSAAWLLSFTWRTDCWAKGIETRGGGKAPLCEFWIPHRHLSTAEDDLPLLSRQREKKKRKKGNGDRTIGSIAARVLDSHMDDCTLTTTVTQKPVPRKLFCTSFALVNILQNSWLKMTICSKKLIETAKLDLFGYFTNENNNCDENNLKMSIRNLWLMACHPCSHLLNWKAFR